MRNRTLFWAQWGPKSGFLDVNVRGRSTDRMLKQLSSEPTLADQERSARLSANVSLQSATALFPRPQQISSDSNYQRDFPNGRRGPARKPQINRNSGQPVRLFPDFSPAVLPTEHKSSLNADN